MTEDGRRLFVGFLPRAFDKDDIRRIFEPFGHIRGVKDMNTDTSAYGCCVLEFKSSSDARNCYEGTNGRFSFPGQPYPIRVKIVTSERQLARAKKDVTDAKYPFEREAGDEDDNDSNEDDDECTDSLGVDSATRTELETLEKLELDSHYTIPLSGIKIFVGSIPYHITSQDLRALFDQYGDIINAQVKTKEMPDGSIKSAGCGFVWFANFKGAHNAVKALNGKVMFKSYNKPLTVRTSDELRDFFKKSGLKLCKIFVRNLPSDCDDESLNSLFSKYGRVIRAFVPVDKDKGTKKNYGFVYYEESESAKRAIKELNGITLPTGEKLEVAFKKSSFMN